eukprot:m.24261 g.24261  ORF g.24261 m.24261 type:complete len:89 (+) comp5636_c0_seq1:4304-4570(+)
MFTLQNRKTNHSQRLLTNVDYGFEVNTHVISLMPTSTTTTIHTLNYLFIGKFASWYSANACGSMICVLCLHTTEATQAFISRLLPFCY